MTDEIALTQMSHMISITLPIKEIKDMTTLLLSVFYSFQTLIKPYYQGCVKLRLQLKKKSHSPGWVQILFYMNLLVIFLGTAGSESGQYLLSFSLSLLVLFMLALC